MRVLVIGGGISAERDISTKSARSVYDAIDDTKHQKEYYDWDGTEDWLGKNADRFDVVLPILHGVGGEDGQIQSILDRLGLKYLGSGVQASKICMDKVSTQRLLADNGILVPKQSVVNADSYKTDAVADSKHVLKPILGGSSVDTFLLREGRLGDEQIQDVFGRHGQMILEELIEGEEVTSTVLDGYDDLPIIAIIPPEGTFFDYENKYNGSSQEICAPDFIDESLQVRVRQISRQCHDIAGCRHISRVDSIITPDQKVYVLEINTMPGMTNQSLVPKAAAHVGLAWSDFVEYLIQLASR